MARPTKNATAICLALSVIALIGVVVGLATSTPLVVALVLLPVVAYEIYRVEGESTVKASWGMGITLVGIFVVWMFDVNWNLAEWLGQNETDVGGYLVPLGDIKTLGAAIIGALAIVLFTRTRGIYTRWLAVVIFVCVAALIYGLNPEVFSDLLRQGTQDAINTNL
jgi:hypothetical protein